MQNAKVLNQKDVRKILAEYFNVPEERVINSKYSYIIIEKEEKENEDGSEWWFNFANYNPTNAKRAMNVDIHGSFHISNIVVRPI